MGYADTDTAAVCLVVSMPTPAGFG